MNMKKKELPIPEIIIGLFIAFLVIFAVINLFKEGTLTDPKAVESALDKATKAAEIMQKVGDKDE